MRPKVIFQEKIKQQKTQLLSVHCLVLMGPKDWLLPVAVSFTLITGVSGRTPWSVLQDFGQLPPALLGEYGWLVGFAKSSHSKKDPK